MSQNMKLEFIVMSVPVLLIAWYMGTAAFDISFNLRRKEIGLLLVKGFSRHQLLRLFLAEAVLIALIGGIFGIGLSFPLIFLVFGGDHSIVTHIIRVDNVIILMVFSIGLNLSSVLQHAIKASKLDVSEALQEYRYLGTKFYIKKWSWFALLLGSYKMIAWLLTIDLSKLMVELMPTQNILVVILLETWAVFDTYVLNYIGPILFFWGFTRVFTQISLSFQEIISKLIKFDIGVLSTKNIRRNPVRAVTIAFLVSIVAGYCFQVIGLYASEQDYNIRYARLMTGADVRFYLTSPQNLSLVMEQIKDIPEILFATAEYEFRGLLENNLTITFIAIEPDEWINVAYYEREFFTGDEVVLMLQEMKKNNNTVILERGIAEILRLNIGDNVSVKFGDKEQQIFNLTIIGFFGPPSPQRSGYYARGFRWSYVSADFYRSLKNYIKLVSIRVLVKLACNFNIRVAVEKIRKLQINDITVSSAEEIIKDLRENPSSSIATEIPKIPLVSLNVPGAMFTYHLGVAFTILAASLGASLVILIGFNERKKEIKIMAARGLSFKQIIGIILFENLAIVSFAVFLGAFAGLVILKGNISIINLITNSYPLYYQIAFSGDSLLRLFTCYIFLFISPIISVTLAVRKNMSEFDKSLREV
jgi:ABC-type antimicrobial peptide transport system permease subunit